jgi:hypothetical protein
VWVLLLFLAFPWLFAAVVFGVPLLEDWHYWLMRAQRSGTSRENEIAIASHGAGFLALCGLVVDRVGGPGPFGQFLRDAVQGFPADWLYWIPALIFGLVVSTAAVWLLSGVNRSLTYSGFRDSRLLKRALLKLGCGGGLVVAFWYPHWGPEITALLVVLRLDPYTGPFVVGLVVWLLVTAAVRLVLVLWQRRTDARGEVERDIAGQEFPWDEIE